MVQWEFFLTRPFGQIMALQTIFSLLSMLVAYFAEFWIEGIATIHSLVFGLFLATLIINSLHLFNLNKRVVTLSAGINLFFPCTLLLFAISLVYTLIMGFGSLIALIGFVDSFRFTRKYMITYALLSCCYIALTFICGYLVVLLGRAAPNGQIFGLATVIIEGDKTSRFEHSAPRFSPVTTPSSGPQHI